MPLTSLQGPLVAGTCSAIFVRNSTSFFAFRFSHADLITVLLHSYLDFLLSLTLLLIFISRLLHLLLVLSFKIVCLYLYSNRWRPLRSFIMDISQTYAIIIGGSFCLLLLINSLPLIVRFVRYLSPLVSKHLIYRYVLHRHRLLGLWS